MMKMYIANSKWLDRRRADYPFAGNAPVSIRPNDKMDAMFGDNVSTSLRPGYRTWCFKTAEARDRFFQYVKENT